jgi:hypothetical protein
MIWGINVTARMRAKRYRAQIDGMTPGHSHTLRKIISLISGPYGGSRLQHSSYVNMFGHGLYLFVVPTIVIIWPVQKYLFISRQSACTEITQIASISLIFFSTSFAACVSFFQQTHRMSI